MWTVRRGGAQRRAQTGSPAAERGLAEATGTNGLNFVFCNTSALHRAAPRRFHGHPRTCDLFRRHISRLNAPPPLRARRTRTQAHVHARAHTRSTGRNTLSFYFSPSFSSRDPRYSSYAAGRHILAPADFCSLRDVITQQSGLFRAYSSTDR